jgi:hypothetical protein
MRGEDCRCGHVESGVIEERGRRAFLRLGAACAWPLLVESGISAEEGRGTGPGSQERADIVLDHIRLEVVRTYHGIRASGSARGEHIRGLAANLDLFGAHLESRKDGAKADAAVRRRIRERGREATAEELTAGYRDVATENSLQLGVASHAERDPSGAASALDAVAASGIVAVVRGHKAALHRLAAVLDRMDLRSRQYAAPRVVRQKPGDDIMGYPEIPYVEMTWCEFLTKLVRSLQLSAALLGLIGESAAAGVLGVTAEALELVKLSVCKETVAP